MSEHGYEEFGLVMPFINTVDHGGGFAADAYTAGFEMGQLWVRIAVALAAQCTPVRATIRRANLTQADLMAMHFQLHLVEDEWTGIDNDDLKAEWAHVTIGSPNPHTQENP